MKSFLSKLFSRKSSKKYILNTNAFFKDGKILDETGKGITGEIKVYNDKGDLDSCFEVKNGIAHGRRAVYHENGKLMSEERFIDGNAHGVYKEYHKNGTIKSEISFKKGSFNGIARSYSEDGILIAEYPYKNGIIVGIAKLYHNNGKLKSEIPYLNDKANGIVHIYNENGEYAGKLIYKDGEVQPIDDLDDDLIYAASSNNIAEDAVDNQPEERFEGMGDVWDAVYGDSTIFLEKLSGMLSTSSIYATYPNVKPGEGAEVAYLSWPQVEGIKILLLAKIGIEQSEFVSAYPLFDGIVNILPLQKFTPWRNGFEGELELEANTPLDVFDPFFKITSNKIMLTNGVPMTVNLNLSAIALSIKKAESDGFTVNSGPMYTMELAKFLEENPGKMAADYEGVKISLAGSRILLPREDSCECEVRTSVISVTEGEFDGQRYYKIYAVLSGHAEEGDELKANIYAFEHVLKGYIPCPGDDIEGVIWMTGYIEDILVR